MTEMDVERLRDLHDAAAYEACIWRRLQEHLVEECFVALCSAEGAASALEGVMLELHAREALAMGAMLRVRDVLGQRPARPAAGVELR